MRAGLEAVGDSHDRAAGVLAGANLVEHFSLSLLDARQAMIALGALLAAGWTVFIRAPDVPLTELIWLSIPLVGTFFSKTSRKS